MEPERRKETALPERAQRSWNSNLLKVKTERRMKIRLLKIFAAVAVLLSFGSCSLLKVSVDTGNPPLPASEANTRMMTRGFYYDLADEIARTADSVAAASSEIPVRIRAIRWKMQATRAAVTAVMQSNPDVALIDTWLLCVRMDSAFRRLPDSLLFAGQTPLVRKVVARLDRKAEHLASTLLAPEKFALMQEFVGNYMQANPVTGSQFTPVNTTLPWIEFLQSKGVETQYNVGSISDVIADLGDRFGGQSEQMVNSIGWSKDIFELQMQQDSVRNRLTRQLDSLERNFDRIVTVMEHLPQIADYMGKSLNTEVAALIETLNGAVDNAFADLDRQRAELQGYISAERKALVDQAQQAVDTAVQNAMDRVPALVAKLLAWIVLFAVIMLGVPFGIGFWLGRVRERAKTRKTGGA